MANIRLVARLDVKGPNLIKGVHLEGLRVIGDPSEFASRYYRDGVDEIIYMDTVASLYGRANIISIVKKTTEDVFIPVTVGGGIRTTDDVQELLDCGADKVAINTAAVNREELISEVSKRFGSQCMVLSIEAKKQDDGTWRVHTDNGREKTGLDVVEWARRGAELGAGEILLTSIDKEGTRKGFDLELVSAVSQSVGVPVIASGGMGAVGHLTSVVQQGGANAVAMADVLHYGRLGLGEIRAAAEARGIKVRRYEPN
jgi:cyclase